MTTTAVLIVAFVTLAVVAVAAILNDQTEIAVTCVVAIAGTLPGFTQDRI